MGVIGMKGKDRYEYNFKNITSLLLLIVLFFVPFFADPYIQHLVIVCFIWGVVATAWNLIMGYAGVFSFAQLAFFSVGAYVAGLSEVYFGISPWIGLFLGGFFASLCGYFLAFPCLRLRGLYIVLVTLAFHNVIPIFIKLAGKWTGGDVGLMGMPHYNFFGFNFAGSKIGYYYLSFSAFLVFHYIMYRIIHSKTGLAFVALRDSSDFAESLGVNREKGVMQVFIISAFITGFMGALYVHYLKVATPRLLELELFITALMMMVLGGMGKFSGAIIGAFIVTFLNESLRTAASIRPILFGTAIIVVVLFFPGGLSRLVDQLFESLRKLVYASERQER
jgi:branched-chain amino acid transport system permease protein